MALSGVMKFESFLLVDVEDVSASLDDLHRNVLLPHVNNPICTEPEVLWGRYSSCRLDRVFRVARLGSRHSLLVCIKNRLNVTGVRGCEYFSVSLDFGECLNIKDVSSISISPGVPYIECDFISLRNHLPFYSLDSNRIATTEGYCYLHLYNTVAADDRALLFALSQRFGKYPKFYLVYNDLLRLGVRLIPPIRQIEDDLLHVDLNGQLRPLLDYANYRDSEVEFYIGGDNSGFTTTKCAAPLAEVSVHLPAESNALLDVVGLVSEESKSGFVKSLLLDNHCWTRKTLDEKLSKDIENITHKRHRPTVVIHQYLSHSQFKNLESDYPEFTLRFDQDLKTSHAYAAASRKIAHALIFKEIGYKVGKRLSTNHMMDVVDVGGNWYSHIVADRPRVHCCCPILSVQDDLREATRSRCFYDLDRPVTPIIEREKRKLHTIKLFEDPKTRFRVRCMKKSQNCNVSAPVLTMIHSAYDMSTTDIADSMLRHNSGFLMGVVMFVPELILEEKGVIPWLDCEWDRSRNDGKIHFFFRGESTFGYSHTWENYKDLFQKKVWWTKGKDRAYVCQMLTNRSGEQYFSLTLLQNATIPHSTLSHRIWFANRDLVQVKYWTFDVRAVTLNTAMVQKTFVCDSWTADKILTYALRQTTETKFNAAEIFSYAVAIDSKVIIDGTTVVRGKQTKPVELFDLAHAIYIQAYVLRYANGRVDKAVLDGIKAERELGSAGILKKIMLYLSSGGPGLSYLESFHQLLNRWIVLPDLFPVSISKAVEFVQYDEILDQFLNPEEVREEIAVGPTRQEGVTVRATIHLADDEGESQSESEGPEESQEITETRKRKAMFSASKNNSPEGSQGEESSEDEHKGKTEKTDSWKIKEVQSFEESVKSWELDSQRYFYLLFDKLPKELHLHRNEKLLTHMEVKKIIKDGDLVVEVTPASNVPIKEVGDSFALMRKIEIRDLFEGGLSVITRKKFLLQDEPNYEGISREEFLKVLIPPRKKPTLKSLFDRKKSAKSVKQGAEDSTIKKVEKKSSTVVSETLKEPLLVPTSEVVEVLSESDKELPLYEPPKEHCEEITTPLVEFGPEVPPEDSTWAAPYLVGTCTCGDHWRLEVKGDGNCFYYALKKLLPYRGSVSQLKETLKEGLEGYDYGVIKFAERVLSTPFAFAEPICFQLAADVFKVDLWIHEREDHSAVQIIKSKCPTDRHLCMHIKDKHLTPLLCAKKKVLWSTVDDVPTTTASSSSDESIETRELKRKDKTEVSKTTKVHSGQSHNTCFVQGTLASLHLVGLSLTKPTLYRGAEIPKLNLDFSKALKLKGRQALFYCSEEHWTYGHGKTVYQNLGWPEDISAIAKVFKCNSVLIQRYTEEAVLPAHKDDESVYDLDNNPVFTLNLEGEAVFSFGADRKIENSVLLQPGDLLIMPPKFQKHNYHGVRSKTPGRISLTFRRQRRPLTSTPMQKQKEVSVDPQPSKTSETTVTTAAQPQQDSAGSDQGRNLKPVAGGLMWLPTGKQARSQKTSSSRRGRRYRLDHYCNSRTYSEIHKELLSDLSEIEKRRWMEFRPHLCAEGIKDGVHRNLVNALGEVMEYWRIHDEVLKRRLNDIYLRIPNRFPGARLRTLEQLRTEGVDKKDVEWNLKRNNIKTFEVSIFDLHTQKWLWRAPGVADYEACFDGEELRQIPGELKMDLNPLVDPREYPSMTECEFPYRYLLFCKETVLLQSGKFYKMALSEVARAVNWSPPEIDFVQGVPGCGKTSYILANHKKSEWPPHSKKKGKNLRRRPTKVGDLVLTTTREGAADIRARLRAAGHEVYDAQYRTLDSYLLNSSSQHKEVWVDEALMQHAGALVLVALKSQCEVLHLMGDRAQIAFIPRMGDVALRYCSIGDLVPISKELNVSHRCPVDVAANLSEHYLQGMKSTSKVRDSMRVERITDIGQVPKEEDAVYLTFKQVEKFDLIKKNFKRVHTIHEFQGLQADKVYVVRASHKPAEEIYRSFGHVLVAMSRHRETLVYYTPVLMDSLAKKISKNPTAQALQAASLQVDQASKWPRAGFSTLFPLVEEVKPIFAPTPLLERPLVALQSWYDLACPGESTFEGTYDQQQVFDDSLSIAVGKVGIDTSRVRALRNRRSTLVPNLRTSMIPVRRSGVKETLLAYFKRNANVPCLSGDLDAEELSTRMVEIFEKSYLDPALNHTYKNFREERVNCSSAAIERWMAGHSTKFDQVCDWPPSILEYANDFYKYMVKKTVKPAFDGTNMSEYKAVQTIAYLAKDVNAVFCPIVRNLTERLQSVLERRFVIFSMMSPEDFAKRMEALIEPRNVDKYFKKEVDFSKYDKSQGEVLHLFEKKLYEKLGFSGELAELYWAAHVCSKYKDYDNGFDTDIWYQRRTGDAATFFGNTLVVMGVLACLFDMSSTHAAAFAGDDSILFSTSNIYNIDKSLLASELFNLESKFFSFKYVYFCSKFLLSVGDKFIFIPDPMKLVTKLGRSDLVDWDHLREYYTSVIDLCKDYGNFCVVPSLDLALAERYPCAPHDSGHLVSALWTLIKDFESFSQLYREPAEGLLLDPSRPKL
uniref:Replicase large subunit n=1 Tax=Rubber tree latent virus 2 TaxID=3079710 RepID=A0AA96PWZ2_9VIRU|nr:polyprotein [Rubber tree latent virus 2]